MNEPLVSAIITTHNRSKLLSRAIESVLSQTYKALECIVIDDSSTDNTKEVCGKYPIHYVFIPKEESKGGNYARNMGIKYSRGKYVAFLDDDDYWLPNKIERQVALIEEKDCELVFCGRTLEILRDNGIEYHNEYPDQNRQGDMSIKILYSIATTTSCILVKKAALLAVGMFDEALSFWQEYELTIRLAQRKPFYAVDETLVVYRVDTRDKNRLTNKYAEWKRSVNYIYKKHSVLYRSLGFRDKERVRSLYMSDAKTRAKNAGKVLSYKYFDIMLALRSKLMGLINIFRNK